MSSLINRYPVGLNVSSVFFPSTLQHLHQQHQHHSRLAAAAAASTTLAAAGQQSDLAAEAENMRVAAAAAAWPFPWRPPHGLADHPQPTDVSRIGLTSPGFTKRGKCIYIYKIQTTLIIFVIGIDSSIKL